jgi:hypothetical protein
LAEEKDGQQAALFILKALRKKALEGDVRAIEVILNRAYGQPKQSIDFTEKTIVVRVPEEDDVEDVTSFTEVTNDDDAQKTDEHQN